MQKIIYTITDEAPALATASFLPVVEKFLAKADIVVEKKDISLASRVISRFSDYIKKDLVEEDALAILGEIVKQDEANVIKLPNISASVPQLKATISELQAKGYSVPDYPEKANNEEEEKIKAIYDAIKGSAVNPVIREGNSDRRAPRSVKIFAKKHPHSMGEWTKESKSHVSSMEDGDFYSNEKSMVFDHKGYMKIVFVSKNGEETVLREKINLLEGEIIDASVLEKDKLVKFYQEQIEDAKNRGVLLSLHMKATMMKVSDPIIFGHMVKTFYHTVFEKYSELFEEIGVNANNGLGDILSKIKGLKEEKEILEAIEDCYKNAPEIAMVNSDKGITNFNVPSDVIIDASMPAAIRNSGKMWGPDGKLKDTKFIIPDKSYAGVYQTTIDFCKENGAFNPSVMGSVSNIGLMAQKAEEYGSHDKTFEIQDDGKVIVLDDKNKTLFNVKVKKGDIFRMCQAKDIPIKNWVELAVKRAEITKTPTIFWLDENRAHDRELIKKVKLYLKEFDTSDLDIEILSPIEATKKSLEIIKKGKNCISVTGNVLRDYLTDLFPILELGTSAKMLSIVPLLNGGRLFETGAGGSAPKHVQQLIEENHLRWDSLGEFLALVVSLEHLASKYNNKKALILSQTLDRAIEKLLGTNKSPSRKVGEIDNRGSHFCLTLYWAIELAKQTDDIKLAEEFKPFAKNLNESREKIAKELLKVQGKSVNLKGYYKLNPKDTEKIMRPSKTFNDILDNNL